MPIFCLPRPKGSKKSQLNYPFENKPPFRAGARLIRNLIICSQFYRINYGYANFDLNILKPRRNKKQD